MQNWILGATVYTCETAVLKLSIGLLLLRIVVKPWHVWTIRITMAVAVLYCTILLFITVFQCIPLSYYWRRTGEGHCLPTSVLTNAGYVHSAILAVADLIFAVIPATMLRNAKMPLKRKILVGFILCLGSL